MYGRYGRRGKGEVGGLTITWTGDHVTVPRVRATAHGQNIVFYELDRLCTRHQKQVWWPKRTDSGLAFISLFGVTSAIVPTNQQGAAQPKITTKIFIKIIKLE